MWQFLLSSSSLGRNRQHRKLCWRRLLEFWRYSISVEIESQRTVPEKKKISPKMLQCSGECYIHSLESQIGRILTFWCLKINGEKSYLTLTIFSCCHFYTIANIIIATPHLCMVRTMLPKMFCFLLMFFKMQHFGCLISRLLKMHDVKEHILPLVLNTKQPLSDIWYLRFQQNNLTNF